jgi:hypothetical protein
MSAEKMSKCRTCQQHSDGQVAPSFRRDADTQEVEEERRTDQTWNPCTPMHEISDDKRVAVVIEYRLYRCENCPAWTCQIYTYAVGIDAPSTLLKSDWPPMHCIIQRSHIHVHISLCFFLQSSSSTSVASKCTLLPGKSGGCSCRGSKTISEVNEADKLNPFFPYWTLVKLLQLKFRCEQNTQSIE